MAEKEKKRRKKAAENEVKEHKQPWLEKYASPEEIEDFLKDHIHLRRNAVRVPARWPWRRKTIRHR